MTGEITYFRKRFIGGFNRKDVVKYISKITAERNEALEEKEKLAEELKAIKAQLEELKKQQKEANDQRSKVRKQTQVVRKHQNKMVKISLKKQNS